MKKHFWLMMGLLLALFACAPTFSRQSLDQVETNISFQVLLQDPEQYRDRVVMFGGEIIQTRTEANETWVEVLQKPLDWQNRPQDADVSYGRFFVQFSGFLDPAIYAPGRKITVIGEVQGKRVERIKDLDYSYPVVSSRESHLWQLQSPSGPAIHFGIGIGTIIR
ncbi:MAG: outer membrane protein slp precursor [Deltaproteobacteria bacterium]|jgi:outer membrane lipoprotein|nr:outer membrane protein slp precursor [Deltaproteobacteria bacterium]MBP1716752.1 outer membrane protein slp precursor [Deltaproteobacteria bacterium]